MYWDPGWVGDGLLHYDVILKDGGAVTKGSDLEHRGEHLGPT
jgi:hypothetical protein